MGAEREPFAGREIAGYRLLHALGAGGAAVVYLAQRLDDPAALVAAKLLRPFPGIDPASAAAIEARFLREAEAARRLNHPNILPVLAYGREDSLNYMILPFMPGGALTARINAFTRGMPLPMAADYLTQIAAALDYAFERGVIHRDVKPANVLIDAEGRLKLADFGIARVFEAQGLSALPTLTAEGQMLGTPAYMAPEQVEGPRVSRQADIYALGVTLYQMVTGGLPFEADTPIGLAMLRLQVEPPPPRRDRADLPAPAQAAILRALARRPEDRYPSAGALARAFDAGVRGQLAPDEWLQTDGARATNAANAGGVPPGSSASTIAATPPLPPVASSVAPGAGWTTPSAPPPTPSNAPTWLDQNPHNAAQFNLLVNPSPLHRRQGAPTLWMLLGVALTLAALIGGALFSGWAPLGFRISGGDGLFNMGQVGSPTNTPIQSPSATASATAACRAIPGFSDATYPASAGGNFPDVPFPSNAVSNVYQTFFDGNYQFTLVNVCAPDASLGSVRAFYAQALPANGWSQSSTFPYAGNPNRACGDAYCWVKGSGPTRYASLERVTANGAQVVYQLRLGLLP